MGGKMKRSVKNLLTLLVVGTVLLATTTPVLDAQSAEENPVASYFSPAPENSEKEIIDVIRWDNNFSFEDSVLIHSNAVPAEVIVGFEDGITAREQESIIAKHKGKILEREPALNAVLVQVSAAHAFIARITKERTVEYAQPNYMTKALLSLAPRPGYTPKDPRWDEQYNLRLIGANYTWVYERGDKRIKVAIVDTGIQYDHPDLKGNYISWGYDWVNNDSNPYDDNGHGTHCAGIIAAEMDNRKGIAGIAQVSVMAEKVLDENGEGNVWDSARGIRHAADEGANILSLSLGTSSYSSIYENACQYAWNAGCLLIAASGNDGIQSIGYPARFDTVIAVGAIDKNKQRYSDSNYGPELELVAPGVDIISTYPTNDYAWYSGTSEAAPHVVGAAALIWSEEPLRTNHQIRYSLQDDAIDLGTEGWDEHYGCGLVDADFTPLLCYPWFKRYVPDDYTSIRAAVNMSGLHTVIIVRDGIYNASVNALGQSACYGYDSHSKTLKIRSENGSANCIVQAGGDDAFRIESHCSITGLTIKSARNGIYAGSVHQLTPFPGIPDSLIPDSLIPDSLIPDSLIPDLFLKHPPGYNTILNNNYEDNRCGIHLDDSNNNSISHNTCLNNEDGIHLDDSNNNSIIANTFSNNEDGVYLMHSSCNQICLNNFINNTENVNSSESTNNTWNSKEEISYNYNGVVYKNYIGNYWDDYEGTDEDGGGIGDTPYIIDSDNKDQYPLMMPSENYQTSDLHSLPPYLH